MLKAAMFSHRLAVPDDMPALQRLMTAAIRELLPQFLARIHPEYRTPANAIVFTSAVALTLALSGSFAQIALVSALARLLMYAGSAAATLRLRSIPPAGLVKPARFEAPLGPAMPLVAIGVCVVLAAGATRAQLLSGIVALVAGAALFATQMGRHRSARSMAM
jgi:amino acid transporter